MTSEPVAHVDSAVPLVHAVTTDEIVVRADFIDVACGVMGALGRRGALHLRASRLSGAQLELLGETLAAAQRVTGAWLVVNDRVDVARALGARAAQLTSRSLTAADARCAAPALAIGASVHGVSDGVTAAESGADWLVAGRVFDADGLLVACGGGAVRIVAVQPSGKRRLAPQAWANGRGLAVGDRFDTDVASRA